MKLEKKFWGASFLLLLVSALVYLPKVASFGYYNDDWYVMFDAHVQGVKAFYEIWRIDRPGRTLLMAPLYNLFGMDPLPYHITAYLFRFLGGMSLLGTLRMLFPKRFFFATVASILFTIYPGFLSQVNAIDFQSHILGLFLALLSIELTVKAILAPSPKTRVLFTIGSILLGWAYLSQMEYFIGLEVFRLAIVLMLVLRGKGKSFKENFTTTLLRWLPFAAAPGGFLIWRLFIFETDRRATDIGAQVGQLFSSPLVGLWWLVHLIQDMINVLLVAWGYPLYTIAYQMRLSDTLIGFGMAAFVVLIVVVGLYWGKDDDVEREATSNHGWMREEYWLGLLTIIGGLLPVILVNRHIVFPGFSRYALPASVGVAILLAAIIEQLYSRSLRMALVGFLVAVSVMTHHANAIRAVKETEVIRDFWWQVSWRAPNIQEGTTLIASYPGVGISEDYFVWGPANLIYYPEKQEQTPIEIKLPAAVLTNDAVLNIITGKGVETPERRGNILTRGFDDLLFIAQTSKNSCVRIIDGNAPELSLYDSHRTMVVAPHSQLDNVLVNSAFPEPPQVVFGNEPSHKWCYYYQKASLARQVGDWESVIKLQEKALEDGYYPEDSIEWMTLLEAYTHLGEKEKMRPYVSILREEAFMAQQACDFLSDAANDEEMQTFIEKKICE